MLPVDVPHLDAFAVDVERITVEDLVYIGLIVGSPCDTILLSYSMVRRTPGRFSLPRSTVLSGN